MRAYVARLVLNAVAADIWPEEDERGEVLRRLVDALVAPGDLPTDDERAAIATYVAVAVTLLRTDVRRLSATDEAALRFRAAATAAKPLLGDVDAVRLETLARELASAYGDVVNGDYVLGLADQIRAPLTGIPAAVAILADEDEVDAIERNGELIIETPLPPVPERLLMRALGLLEEAEEIVVRGRQANGRGLACVAKGPLLVIARETPAGLGGKLYRLSDGVTPRLIVAGWRSEAHVRDNMPPQIGDWLPGREPPPQAIELLRSAGLA
jgi:hypothetical protein